MEMMSSRRLTWRMARILVSSQPLMPVATVSMVATRLSEILEVSSFSAAELLRYHRASRGSRVTTNRVTRTFWKILRDSFMFWIIRKSQADTTAADTVAVGSVGERYFEDCL